MYAFLASQPLWLVFTIGLGGPVCLFLAVVRITLEMERLTNDLDE